MELFRIHEIRNRDYNFGGELILKEPVVGAQGEEDGREERQTEL